MSPNNQPWLRDLAAFVALVGAVALAQSPKTDYGVYPIPKILPALPSAGATATDPTFGTQIIRVTDEKDGFNCSTVYSYWPNFNRDSTWLLVNCEQAVSTWRE